MRAWLVPTLFLAGCATYYGVQLNDRFGAPDPARYDRMPASYPADEYAKVRTIVDQRCSVCHGCNDAPCQLNLASHEGLTRGANRERVYGTRLAAVAPTRLFFDAQSVAQWRTKGFHPVLNERAVSPEAEREASVLYRLLALKAANPLPDVAVLPKGQFDFSLDRAEQCPAIEAMSEFEKKNPLAGMPYGMRGLSAAEQATLTRWIEAGAPRAPIAPLPPGYAKHVAQWEAFLNGESLKARLASRYIYEHWFIGHFYFSDLPGNEFFDLVRSKTPPGQPIDVIATRRPYDDPGVERVYYRLRRLAETPLAKTHMPYALNDARMAWLKALFIDAPYEVSALPSHEPEVASNPFVAFRELPVESRYRLMLEEAQFTLMGFIKGPVCRGQVALDVINDHFWVMFEEPDAKRAERQAEFLARELANLRLPAEEEQGASGPLKWRRYAVLEAKYLKAKSTALAPAYASPTLEYLWDGDGRNRNAALTVMRHFDSASVVQGLLGEQPQTVLVLGYPTLERIHYLLVAGFDVYGNVGHQLATRLYMDFLRMEGEMNFLALLPRAERQAVRGRWYRGADKAEIGLLGDAQAYFPAETGIRFATADPLAELYAMMKQHAAPVTGPRYALSSSGFKETRELERLAALRGRALSHLPEASILTVRDAAGAARHFSLIANRAHSNVAELFDEAERRLPDEDTVLVASGFIPAYPNAFFVVESSQLGRFVDAVAGLKSEADYAALASAYGVRRTDLRFWAHSDALQAAWRRSEPREAGLFDYNRLDNR
jgi:hypothetical protein